MLKKIQGNQSVSAFALTVTWAAAGAAMAGGAFNYTGSTLAGGTRWDAAPRTVTLSGTPYERSLAGGLRYSMQGTTYDAYRDLFTWSGGTPTTAAFTTAVNQAFNAWAAVDPATGLGSSFVFLNDPSSAVVGANTGSGGTDTRGAEIDLFGSTDAGFWNVGNSGTQGETGFGGSFANVTLTSGTTGYSASAINGADIILNSNPQAVYSLDLFRRLLTHEIGHALGFADVEGSINPGAFIDDNYDGSTSATALATLTNSWAGLVNPLNPSASVGLQRYTIPVADPGLTTSGVNILMESFGVGIGATNPVTSLVPLTNDDYGIRQFLYPQVPEPAALGLAIVGVLSLRRRRAM